MKYLFITIILCSLLSMSSGAVNVDSLEQNLSSSNDTVRYTSLMKLARIYTMSDPDKSIDYAVQAHLVAEELNNELERAKALIETGRAYHSNGENLRAIEYYSLGHQILEKLKDEPRCAKNHNRLSLCYTELHRYDKALEHQLKSLQLYKETENEKGQAKSLGEIGNIYKSQGYLELAIDYYHKAIEISEAVKDYQNTALTLNRIGSLYHSLDEFEKVLEYYYKALKIREEIGDKKGIAGSYNNLGIAYAQLNNDSMALDFYFKALEVNEEMGNERWKSFNLNNISRQYTKQGEYEKALSYHEEALAIKERRNDNHGIAKAMWSIGILYYKLNQVDKAIEHYLSSLELAKNLGSPELLMYLHYNLAEAHESKNNHKLALTYYRQYVNYKDTLFSEEKLKNIKDIEIKYETKRTERENELLKKDKELLEKNAEIKAKVQLILLLTGSGFLILSILLFLLIRIKNRSMEKNRLLFEKEQKVKELELKTNEIEKQRLEEIVFAEKKINILQKEKLELKNRELGTTTLHILSKNQVLAQIKDEINNNEMLDKSHCSGIIELIDGDATVEKDWDQFKKHFEQIYDGFFENLSNKFPSLTPYDLKLCAYLQINLNTKEIASMLNVTVAAINKSRNRLRKKLAMEQSENFLDFFSHLN